MKITDHIKSPGKVVGIGHGETIKQLQETNEKLGKQVEMLQFACREAATKIKKLEEQVESLTNPLIKMRKGGL
tara:strand:- start:50 stop:268 length:219 start_codon:yes stop_codon:yes gene_type:complete